VRNVLTGMIVLFCLSAVGWTGESAAKSRQGGFTFERFASRHDANRDGIITQAEFVTTKRGGKL